MEKIRRKNLAAEIKKAGLAGMLVCPSEELLFLTGFTPMMCERFQGLFITASGDCFYVCNLLYKGEIEHAYKGEIPTYTWMDGESMTAVMGEALAKHGLLGQMLGVNSSAQAFNVLDIVQDCGVSFSNGLAVLEEARILKTAAEAEDLRRAARIADDVFTQALSFIRPGLLEADISDFLQQKMAEAGGAKTWSIVASGPNSSYPHYMGADRVIEEQDIIILDFGCAYHGMYSDISRTVFVGHITDEQKKIYGIVREAQEAAERVAINGAFIPDVDQAARGIIAAAGYQENFFNRVGHGIGYMIHEGPDIKKSNQRHLQPGMAFSIEPGIYLSGHFGIRIEDIVLATIPGQEVLNHSSKEIFVL